MENLQAHLPQLLVMLGLLCLSAFFSGSETALFTLSKVDLRSFRSGKTTLSRIITSLAGEPSEFLGTVLFCNMLVNISFYSLASGVSSQLGLLYGHEWEVIFSLSALILVIIFGEVTPKSLAVLAPRGYITVAAMPMYILHRLFSPVRRIMRQVTALVRRLSKGRQLSAEDAFEELKILLETSASDGELTRMESTIVSEVIDLSVVKVKEFMTPRVDLIMAEEKSTVADILALARESGRTKIPIFRQYRDEIIGILDARDLYLGEYEGGIAKHIQPPVYVPVFQRASQALKFLQAQHTDLAIAVDEYGGTAGIVTLSDVLEEIFGQEAGKEDEPLIQSLGPGHFIVAGNVSLRDWRNLLRVAEDLPPVDTVGGLVAYLLGRVPHEKDVIKIGNVQMRIARVIHRRVTRVEIEVLEPEAHDAWKMPEEKGGKER